MVEMVRAGRGPDIEHPQYNDQPQTVLQHEQT